MTTLTYRRCPQAGLFGFRWNYHRLLSNLSGHRLFLGNLIWFLMVFTLTRIYLWRIFTG